MAAGEVEMIKTGVSVCLFMLWTDLTETYSPNSSHSRLTSSVTNGGNNKCVRAAFNPDISLETKTAALFFHLCCCLNFPCICVSACLVILFVVFG